MVRILVANRILYLTGSRSHSVPTCHYPPPTPKNERNSKNKEPRHVGRGLLLMFSRAAVRSRISLMQEQHPRQDTRLLTLALIYLCWLYGIITASCLLAPPYPSRPIGLPNWYLLPSYIWRLLLPEIIEHANLSVKYTSRQTLTYKSFALLEWPYQLLRTAYV